MSSHILCKFRSFSKKIFSETIWYIELKFSEITDRNCYALSIFRNFILLASSDNDKPMLMRQKM